VIQKDFYIGILIIIKGSSSNGMGVVV